MASGLKSADFMVILLFCFSLLPCLVLSQTNVNCFDVNFNPSVCIPGPENIVRARDIVVSPQGGTCGSPASGFCHPSPRTDCYTCNASSPRLSHGPEKMKDNDYPSSYWGTFYQPTWWQSITWWDASQRGLLVDGTIKVNLTLSMNKSYDITGDIKMIFYSSKPNAFIIEKSMDFGASWIPYRYYADNCNVRFGSTVPTSSANQFEAVCIQATNAARSSGSEVKFNPMSFFPSANFWQASIQQYVMATDIRIRLEYPWTNGNENINQQRVLNQFYYDITDLQVNARCHCNGHAPYCHSPQGQMVCFCKHETEGVDCERCKPLYNNKPWKAAESSDKPNPCEKCQCNSHAASCVYNATLGYGICNDCAHNTTGLSCDQCKEKFYRNLSLPVNNIKACLPCDCFQPGITNNGSCVQNATLSPLPIGQCLCKGNFRGRKCDSCEAGFYGITIEPIGECKACNCSLTGVVNGSIACHQITGQCTCKSSVDGYQCTSCRNGFYDFPNTTAGECRQCFCNQGGAYNNICNKLSGECSCRPGVSSFSCDRPMPGYFYPDFDFLTLEAESGIGSFETVSNVNGAGSEFTGRGFARLTTGSSVTFYFQSPFTARYTMVMRFKLLQPNKQLRLQQTFHYNNNSISLQFSSFNVTLPSASTTAFATHYQPVPTELLANGNYSVTLTIADVMNSTNQTVDIDSVVFMWNYEMTKFFLSANQTMRNATAQCWNNKQSLLATNQVSSLCKEIEFSINTQLFNGSLACNCNAMGSVNTSDCEKYGGQCQCKPGVTGRTCDQCMPGFYNFTSNGCTACNCTVLGSKSLVCDVISGQCPCHPGVVNRTCSQCRDSFYGFQTGRGCNNCSCNWDGSKGVYCGENGECDCKNTTMGQKCDICKPMHFNFSSNGCTPCQCDPSGSVNLQCDVKQGNCSCKQSVEGTKCNQCSSGTYNLQRTNPYGCQACFCYNQTEQCSSAAGFYASPISSTFTNTTDSWIVRYTDGLNAVYSNTSTGISITPANTASIVLHSPQTYHGQRLSSYAQALTIRLTLSMPSDQTVATASVRVIIHSTYGTNAAFTLPLNTSRQQEQTVAVRLHEFYATRRVSAWSLQHTMSSISQLSIQFDTVNVSHVKVSSVALSSTANGSLVSDALQSGYVEVCSCPTNYTGRSCQSCSSGYTRNLPGNDSYAGCKLCSCNSRSLSCDPQTGVCSNCRLGSEGRYCERCQAGVLEPDCTRCIPGYYGLNDTSFPGCRPCNCMLLNTVGRNGSVCDQVTGQCDCRPNIGGRTCNRCAENAVNSTTAGCQSCSECYGLIQTEVHALRRNVANITTTLTSVQSISQLSTTPTFGQRLDALTQSVTALVTAAQNSSSVESGLAAELTALNVSLDNMQATLRVNVSNGINQTDENIAVLNATTKQIDVMRTTIYRLLWASVYVLETDATRKRNTTNTMLGELSSISSNVSSKLAEYELIWNATRGKTAQVLTQTANATSTSATISNQLDGNRVRMNGSATRIQQLKNLTSDVELKAKTLENNFNYLRSNISALVQRSNSTLETAKALRLTTNASALELQARYEALQKNLTALNTSLNTMMFQQMSLKQSVDDAKNRSSGLNSSLSQMESRLVLLASQATGAEQTANAAVRSSMALPKEAQDMLEIVQNFNRTSTNAENMASLSLKNTQEVNTTSRQAIANTERIGNDLTTAKSLAEQSLAIARQSSYLSGNLSVSLAALLASAHATSERASTSPYDKNNYFNETRANVSRASVQTIQPASNVCKNLTESGKAALVDANLASQAAANVSAEVAAKGAMVQQTMAAFQNIGTLNATSLLELQNLLATHRDSFDASSVKTMLAQLRTAYARQQDSMQQYRARIGQLRTEVTSVKGTIDELSTLQGCS
eukprot:gene15666-17246_t